MRNRDRNWLGAVGAIALLLAACGSADAVAGGGDDVVVVEEPATPDSTVDTTDTIDTTDGTDTPADEAEAVVSPADPASPIAADAVYDPEAEPILQWYAPFEPGSYRTGALGTPMSFTATEALNTQPNGAGHFVLSDISSRAPDDRELVFLRVGNFADPTAPNSSIDDHEWWPSDDFRGWLENLHPGVIATDPVDTTVNGLPAIRVDLRLGDDIDCGWLPGSCVGFIENNGQDVKALNKGSSYRVWVVEQGEHDPLMISAGIARDEDAGWFDRADAVMETIAFGEVEPNPTQWLVPGTNQLNVFGGVDVTLPDDLEELTNGRPRLMQLWNGRGFAQTPITEQPGAVYFADRPHDMEGVPLVSTDDVVALLSAGGAELTELDPTTVGGIDTRVFDVTTADVGAILFRFSAIDLVEDFYGWDAPAAGRIWLIEHPDRGLMMFSTHAFDNVDDMLPRVNALGEAIAESLIFIGS